MELLRVVGGGGESGRKREKFVKYATQGLDKNIMVWYSQSVVYPMHRFYCEGR